MSHSSSTRQPRHHQRRITEESAARNGSGESDAKLELPPPAVPEADSRTVPCSQVSPEGRPDLTQQLVELFCDGIENVHRSWLAGQGLADDHMPSWKDIDSPNQQFPYDEDAPKTIEELFASMGWLDKPVKPDGTRKRRAKKRARSPAYERMRRH
jgi:hypothetical protein